MQGNCKRVEWTLNNCLEVPGKPSDFFIELILNELFNIYKYAVVFINLPFNKFVNIKKSDIKMILQII